MAHSTKPDALKKPAKPYPDFPLFVHQSDRWAKKIRGDLCYFGKASDDPDGAAAIEKYQEQREDLYAGRKPRGKSDGITIKDLVNRFQTVKRVAVDDGELAPKTFYGYYCACELVFAHFGKNRLVSDLRTEDFEALRAKALKGMALASRSVVMQKVRAIFKFAYDNEMIDRPIRFGTAFASPSSKSVQKDKIAKKATRILSAEQILALIAGARTTLRAMLLLGINCGYGNNDCATLTFDALDLDNAWICHPRPKTSVPRRAKLWPETVEAIRKALTIRKEPSDPAYADLVFLSIHGLPWVRWVDIADATKSSWSDSLCTASRMLFKKLGISGGASFYSLRRMTETIGGGCKDQVAVDAVMGHSRGDMASVYRLNIEDSRLEAVADHIHQWLYGT